MTVPDDAVDTPEILGDAKLAVLLGPDVVKRKAGKVINSRRADLRSGFPVGLVTGDTEGARYLPLHAALAVRYGLDPQDALKAITIGREDVQPRRPDRLPQARQGRRLRGVLRQPVRDDQRVLLVVVNGRVVVDNRRGTK